MTAPRDSRETARGPTERPSDGPPAEPADVEAVIDAMRTGASRTARRERDRAARRLAARNDLTPAKREALDRLTTALVTALLAPPVEGLRAAADAESWEAVGTAVDLFDPPVDGESAGRAIDDGPPVDGAGAGPADGDDPPVDPERVSAAGREPPPDRVVADGPAADPADGALE